MPMFTLTSITQCKKLPSSSKVSKDDHKKAAMTLFKRALKENPDSIPKRGKSQTYSITIKDKEGSYTFEATRLTFAKPTIVTIGGKEVEFKYKDTVKPKKAND